MINKIQFSEINNQKRKQENDSMNLISFEHRILDNVYYFEFDDCYLEFKKNDSVTQNGL